MRYFVDNLKNNIDFFLRNVVPFSRKNYFEKPENKDNIFENNEQKELFQKLKNKYDLEILENTTIQNYLENLYFLNAFDLFLPVNINRNPTILDIGSKNWYYAKAEYIFFQKHSKNLLLNGIELDSNRLNYKFYSRNEIAKFHIKNLENTNYIQGDLLNHNHKYDYIIWILPFIRKTPHVKWGLPLKHFKPYEMLKHAYELLNEKGLILIINQGIEEYEIQKELNNKLNLNAQYFNKIPDMFNLFHYDRFCCVIEK